MNADAAPSPLTVTAELVVVVLATGFDVTIDERTATPDPETWSEIILCIFTACTVIEASDGMGPEVLPAEPELEVEGTPNRDQSAVCRALTKLEKSPMSALLSTSVTLILTLPCDMGSKQYKYLAVIAAGGWWWLLDELEDDDETPSFDSGYGC